MCTSREAAIYWDVENCGLKINCIRPKSQRALIKRIESVAYALIQTLSEKGLGCTNNFCNAYACRYESRRLVKTIPPEVIDFAAKAFFQKGFILHCTEGIADYRLIKDVRRALVHSYPLPLPEVVVIMSDDAIFCDLVYTLRTRGHEVGVITNNPSTLPYLGRLGHWQSSLTDLILAYPKPP